MMTRREQPGRGLRAGLAAQNAEDTNDRLIAAAGWIAFLAPAGWGVWLAVKGMSPETLAAIPVIACIAAVPFVLKLVHHRQHFVALTSAIAVGLFLTFGLPALHQAAGDPTPPPLAGYPLAIAAAVLPFVIGSRTDRGVTALINQAGVLVGVAIMGWSEQAGVLVTVGWLLAVLVARSELRLHLRLLHARLSTGVTARLARPAPLNDGAGMSRMSRANVEAGAAAEELTGALLNDLPDDWHVLHSRRIPASRADLDHLLVSERGVFLIDTKDWKGRIVEGDFTTEQGNHSAFALNGDPDQLVNKLGVVVFEADEVTRRMMLRRTDVHIAICFTDRIVLPRRTVDVSFHGATITLLHHDALIGWLNSFPRQTWREPTKRQMRRASRRHVDPADLADQVNRRFVADLAIAADYTFPPA